MAGTLHEYVCTFVRVSRRILLKMGNTSEKICRENRNVLFKNILLKFVPFMRYVDKYGRIRQTTDDNIIQRMRLACWITKATGTHSEYVILIAFPR
jgi:hypothetical protein